MPYTEKQRQWYLDNQEYVLQRRRERYLRDEGRLVEIPTPTKTEVRRASVIKEPPFYITFLSKEYMAGFFDGEGHVFIGRSAQQHGSRFGVRFHLIVGLTNTDLNVLGRVSYLYGCKIAKEEHDRNLPVYRMTFTTLEGYRFLKDVLPFLVIKDVQAALAIDFYDFQQNRQGHPITLEEAGKYEWFRQKIRQCNARTGKPTQASKKVIPVFPNGVPTLS